MKLPLLCTIAAAATAAFPSPVAAQAPFTFRVPVELRAILPEAGDTFVQCVVWTGSIPRWDLGSAGTGAVAIPLDANGDYSGILTVEVRISENQNPSWVSNWGCRLMLDGSRPVGQGVPGEEDRSKPGTELVTWVTGTVP